MADNTKRLDPEEMILDQIKRSFHEDNRIRFFEDDFPDDDTVTSFIPEGPDGVPIVPDIVSFPYSDPDDDLDISFYLEEDEDIPDVPEAEEVVRIDPFFKTQIAQLEHSFDIQTAGSKLFSLVIQNPRGTPVSLMNALLGNIHLDESDCWIRLMEPESFQGIQLRLSPDAQTVLPILKYLHRTNSPTVALVGKQNGDLLDVYRLIPNSGSIARKTVSEECIWKMLQCLKNPEVSTIEPGNVKDTYRLREEEDLNAFVEICSSRFPDWVVFALRKNLESSQGFQHYRSERNHSIRAMEILMNIDWNPRITSLPSAEEVRRALDEEFYGLENVKLRIEEFFSQIRKTGTFPKWGILLNGPTGTGKTSIEKKIAQLLGIGTIQMDMSTLGTETLEIAGSSRSYENAKPGLLLDSMFKHRSSMAVLMVNELDKAYLDPSGMAKADALLSVLDKKGFYENFLEETIPTDNLFCVASCNDIHKIPAELRNRFFVIDIPGYTSLEKKIIFQKYVFPKALKCSQIESDRLEVSEAALDRIVSEYLPDAGVPELERITQRLIGHFFLSEERSGVKTEKMIYCPEDISHLFGPPKVHARNVVPHPGIIRSAFYHEGQAHFFLMEAALMPGTGRFEALGFADKTQEAQCKAAYICVRNTTNASSFDLSRFDVTIMVSQAPPEGAENYVGLACYAALCSAIMNRSISVQNTCFLGGCDLTGNLFFDKTDPLPMLQAMQAGGVTSLYAPLGISQGIGSALGQSSFAIVEAPDAATLFSLAVTQNGLPA